MKLFDMIKKVGSSVIREVVPGGGLAIDAINTLLPEDKQLPSTATGADAERAINSLPPDLKAQILSKELDVEESLIKARGEAVKAEIQGDEWLQKNWRPITMLVFVGLIGAYWFGWVGENLSESAVEQMFELVKIGLGGYVIGRSVEKVAKEGGGKGLMGSILGRK